MKRPIIKIILGFSLLVFCMGKLSTAPVLAQTPIQEIEEQVFAETDNLAEGAWHPSGQYLAVTVNSSIYIYDDELIQVATLSGHTDTVTSIDWNSDGSRLATVSADTTLRIWDMNEGQNFGTPLILLTDHTEPVFRVRWSPDDTMLATLALDSVMTNQAESDFTFYSTWVWDTSTWNINHQLPSLANATALEWSPDSTFVINSGKVRYQGPIVKFWNASSGLDEHHFVDDPIIVFTDLAWNPVYDYISMTSAANFVRSFDTSIYESHSSVRILDLYDGVLDWKSSGDFMAVGDYHGNIYVVDFALGKLVGQLSNAHQGKIHDIGWQPQSNTLFTLSNEDKTVRLWSVPALPSNVGTPTVTPFFVPTHTASPNPTNVPPTATPTPQIVEKIAFAQVVDNASQLFSMNLDGSNRVNISNTSTSPCEPSWSPDGRKIAYTSPCVDQDNIATSPVGRIYVRDLATGVNTQITQNVAPDYSPAWSPDSNQVVFTSNRKPISNGTSYDDTRGAEIFVANADGTDLQYPFYLIFSEGDDYDPDWSIDDQIAFVSVRSGEEEIYWMYSDGGVMDKVPEIYPNSASPSWSPDGSHIAFVAGLTKGTIYVLDTATSQVVEYPTGDLDVHELDWSPYSQQILFTAYTDGVVQLFILDLNNGGITQITSDAGDKSNPAWAPGQNVATVPTQPAPTPTATPVDVNKLSYAEYVAPNYQIFSANLDGSGAVNLSNSAYNDDAPIWSPDGTRLAYVSNRSGYAHIVIRDNVTSGELQLTTGSSNNISPSWSPDSQYILFTSDRDGGANEELYTVKADGSRPVRRITKNTWRDFAAHWSTGGKIVFLSNRDGTVKPYSMNSVPPADLHVIETGLPCLHPRFSPDGSYLACINGIESSSETTLYITTDDGTLVDEFDGFHPGDAKTLDWSPDGTQLVLIGETNVFIFDWIDSKLQPVIVDGSTYRGGPSWGPGIERFAFPGSTLVPVNQVAYEGFPSSFSQIFTMNLDGSNPVNLSNENVNFSDPAWSPDGTQIAYIKNGNLQVEDAAGTTVPTELTTCAGDPAWSPDGTQIVYARTCSSAEGIYIVSVDGAIPEFKAYGMTSLYEDIHPHWSIDNQIVFSGEFDDGSNQYRDILVIKPYSTQVRRLTSDIDMDRLPVWSPDGSKIAFVSAPVDPEDQEVQYPGHIYVMNADGTGRIQLTNELNVYNIEGLSWSFDGTQLLFDLDADLYVLDVDTFDSIRPLLDEVPPILRYNPDWRPDTYVVGVPTLTPGTPTTPVPTTEVPPTPVPTTAVPTTEVPPTPVPTTAVPTTEVPPTPVPTTEVPPTSVPATDTPIPPTATPSVYFPHSTSIYQSSDSKITYTGSWDTINVADASGGSFERSALDYSAGAGFTIYGTGLVIYRRVAESNANWGPMTVCIDSDCSHVLANVGNGRALAYVIEGLDLDFHQVVLSFDEFAGNTIHDPKRIGFDAFYVLGPLTAGTANTNPYDQSGGSLQVEYYGGNWSSVNNTNAYNGSFRQTTDPFALARFKFTGRSATLLVRTNASADFGRMRVCRDASDNCRWVNQSLDTDWLVTFDVSCTSNIITRIIDMFPEDEGKITLDAVKITNTACSPLTP